jgi:hypothetical protein
MYALQQAMIALPIALLLQSIFTDMIALETLYWTRLLLAIKIG